MSQATPDLELAESGFVDRRVRPSTALPHGERRQFANDYASLSPAAAELGRAVDSYKVRNRRRFVTYEELLDIFLSLGYRK